MCPYADLYCCWFRIPLYWRELHYRSGLVLEASPRWPTACLFPALHPLSCVLKSRTTCGLAARIAHRISSTPMRAYVCWVQNSIVVAIHFREDAAFRDRQRRTPPLGIMPERKSYREAIYSSTNWNLYNYSSNFPHFIGFPACPLVKWYVVSLIFALMR